MFGSRRVVVVAAVAHVAGIEIIIALVVRRIAGVVTEEAASARIARRRRPIAAADDTRYGRSSGAEKRAAAASRWGGAHRISALLLWISLWISLWSPLWSPLGLTGARPRAPCAARTHSTGPHGRNGGAWLVASHDCVAHAVEKAATALGRCRNGAFELFNSGVGALEGFVLHQHRLHQRVNRIGRAAEPFTNQPFGIGVTTLAFQRGEAVEQIRNELLFLRGHGCPPHPG